MLENTLKLDTNRIQNNMYSTLVVGSGIAGLYTALKIAEKGVKIAFITKSKLGESNSRYAQGGVAVVLPENTYDSIDLHVKDTITAGAGLSNPEVTRFISTCGSEVITDLIKYGVQFDRCKNNKLATTLEAAHSVRRVLHSGGDATGKNIEETLVTLVKDINNIDIFEEHQAVELLIDKNKNCRGAVVFDIENNKHKFFISEFTVLATGGLSQVYSHTTNPSVATGDGVALVYRAGGVLQDMEFVQFHPTAFHSADSVRFLISEAVRGEGAKLRNVFGELFAHKYDERADLAPRDILARAIFTEMKSTNSDYVFLDATCIAEEVLRHRFPNIIEACKKSGIDISKDYIPVSPAAHYTMGGIKTDVKGQTTINNLYAIGEAACTSLHGANRLASNSLLECVVLAKQVAEGIINKQDEVAAVNDTLDHITDETLIALKQEYFKTEELKPVLNLDKIIESLKNAMWFKTGIVKNAEGLKDCLNTLEEITIQFDRTGRCSSLTEYEVRSLILVARLIVEAALNREESRGSHYREDFPQCKKKAVHSYTVKKEDERYNGLSTSQTDSEQLCSVCS